ncbi:pirin family protein [Methanomassiliicoccus luminyensis]|uniref:pirin family protein n=1 Tax=Methanomassiliicoccus luminyensis TaxID=1080712 RepID=UPI00037F9108|nr:pirin family protein [Methanomassiliicoccus luminyensis]
MKDTTKMMRRVDRVLKGEETMEGAGVRLKRVLGRDERSTLDPFLMLDMFESDDPRDYQAGFPAHPHRGIETVTYMLKGEMEHGDSTGTRGLIGPGEAQWMTAGSGIIHQEMPVVSSEGINGLQLWVNLPQRAKMKRPQYRDVRKDSIKKVDLGDGVEARIIAGELEGSAGPVRDLESDIQFFDVVMNPGSTVSLNVPRGRTSFALVLDGAASFEPGGSPVKKGEAAVFADGDSVQAGASDRGARFLLISGDPLNEPVFWRGPIVVNSQEELDRTFEELRNGTFVK